jgi:hypothetical protein
MTVQLFQRTLTEPCRTSIASTETDHRPLSINPHTPFVRPCSAHSEALSAGLCDGQKPSTGWRHASPHPRPPSCSCSGNSMARIGEDEGGREGGRWYVQCRVVCVCGRCGRWCRVGVSCFRLPSTINLPPRPFLPSSSYHFVTLF